MGSTGKDMDLQPVTAESIFDERFARMKSNSGASKRSTDRASAEKPQQVNYDIEAKPIVVKSSIKRSPRDSPARADKDEVMRQEIERAKK